MTKFEAADWTLARYAELLDAARQRRSFEPFSTAHTGPHVLWRHDIDYSIEHALLLARLEAQKGVRATYFILLSSPYYNLLELESTRQLMEIVRLGHWVGLHFDPERYTQLGERADLESAMRRERDILADIARVNVETVSLHNPAFAGLLHMDDERLGGMINTYSARLRQSYTYCSDSFGYWRHRPIHEVIADAEVDRMHVLTHPVWWWPRPMGSRQRIRSCVEAHWQRLDRIHDDLLTRAGQIGAVIAADETRGFVGPSPSHPSDGT